jgi:hypothetical protein
MRFFAHASVAAALVAVPRAARADEPDTALALFAGASVDVVAFVAGGTAVSTSPAGSAGDARRSLGWLAIGSGFVAAPVVAHGIVGEWARGAIFSVVPAASLSATVAMYRTRPDSVENSSLDDQRVTWGLFTAALIASTVGLVDVLSAPARQRPLGIGLVPAMGPTMLGLQLQGRL